MTRAPSSGKVAISPGGNVEHIQLNSTDPWTEVDGERSSLKTKHPTLSDPAVRQALALLIDKDSVEKYIYGRTGTATANFINNPERFASKTTRYEFNVDKANDILEKAGWKKGADGFRYKDGKKLAPVVYGISGAFKEIAEAVQGDLRKVGIDLQIQLFDSTVALGKLATQEFDAFGMSFPYVSAGYALNLYFRSANTPTPNRMNWKDKETDELLDKGSTATDDATRAAAYAAVQEKVHYAAVWIPLFHEPLFVVAGPKLKPIRAHGNYGCGLYKGLGIALR